ncbi:SDR family NAD(P)-dependent oxidoreductase [Yinghuangia aomiensis]|uniref:SDR family NAD(P)-dependent oxidoreductase n=1 Tax=Yinghuangia aomiensis TaxID=676205 RepID=A0ABP9HJW3_9ACTN
MSEKRFAGRRALVTGASRGIGASLARRLAAEGADVAITARSLDTSAKLPGTLAEVGERIAAHGGKVALIGADLANEDDRERIVPEAAEALGGPIDILVNNAAMGVYAAVADYPLRRARLHYEINVIAPLHLAQAAIPGMRERGEGWIVNVSSATAKPWPGPPFVLGGTGTGTTVYGSSKAALNRLTNGLAAELHGAGIRVNTVEPRAAVMSEGAQELVGHIVRPDQIETMEQMVEGALALCDCPADYTGRVGVSLDLIEEFGRTVRSLDGV